MGSKFSGFSNLPLAQTVENSPSYAPVEDGTREVRFERTIMGQQLKGTREAREEAEVGWSVG